MWVGFVWIRIHIGELLNRDRVWCSSVQWKKKKDISVGIIKNATWEFVGFGVYYCNRMYILQHQRGWDNEYRRRGWFFWIADNVNGSIVVMAVLRNLYIQNNMERGSKEVGKRYRIIIYKKYYVISKECLCYTIIQRAPSIDYILFF